MQISIWISASLRKKQELAQAAAAHQTAVAARFELSALVEPAFTIVGHEHLIYYAYLRDNVVPGRNGTHVLGPDNDRFGRLSTDSVRGIFRLARVYGNVLEYGSGDDGFWGRFMKPVLDKLASV